MTKQNIELNPRILDSAKQEFMTNGYINTSLNSICNKAGVTTGAIYKRYKGKEELFEAVVRPTINRLNSFAKGRLENSNNLLNKKNLHDMWQNQIEIHKLQTNFLYDNFEGIYILLCCSEGSKFSDFSHGFIQGVTDSSYEFSKLVFEEGLTKELIDKDTLHVLLTGYWISIFEPIKHGYSREKALEQSEAVAKLFNWKEVLGY